MTRVTPQVEVQREKGTRCFFPVITMFLLMSILLSVTCPYAIQQGFYIGGTTIVSLFAAYHIMATFCHLGHTFVSQVGRVKQMLRLASCRVLYPLSACCV